MKTKSCQRTLLLQDEEHEEAGGPSSHLNTLLLYFLFLVSYLKYIIVNILYSVEEEGVSQEITPIQQINKVQYDKVNLSHSESKEMTIILENEKEDRLDYHEEVYDLLNANDGSKENNEGMKLHDYSVESDAQEISTTLETNLENEIKDNKQNDVYFEKEELMVISGKDNNESMECPICCHEKKKSSLASTSCCKQIVCYKCIRTILICQKEMAKHLRKDFYGKAHQCPQCKYGPVEHFACGDLSQGLNRCPQCRYYSPRIERWPMWDGTIPIAMRMMEGRFPCPFCRKDSVTSAAFGSSTLVCTKCYRMGHMKTDCTYIECNNCGKPGHLEKYCTYVAGAKCAKCNRIGHLSEKCVQCIICKRVGHLSDVCRYK